MSTVDALARLPMFSGTDRADLDELCRVASPVDFVPGSPVFQQGAPADVALLVVSGRLEARVEVDGTRCVLGSILPGEIVGEAALLNAGGERLATVTAVEPTSCVLLAPDLLNLVSMNAAWVAIEQHLLASLVKRIGETEAQLQQAWREASDEAAPGRRAAEPTDEGTTEPASLRSRLRGLLGGRG